MTIKNTLTKIVLAPILAGAITLFGGCSSYPEYHFEGKIGDEEVKFYEGRISSMNYLRVKKKNGIEIEYKGRTYNDLKLEYVNITKNGKTTAYWINDETGKPILEEAQKQFDSYLSQIKEAKIKEGLENLK